MKYLNSVGLSSTHKMYLGIYLGIISVIYNITAYFTQDIVLSNVLYNALGFMLGAAVLSKIIKKDAYSILEVADALPESTKKDFTLFSGLSIIIPVLFNLLGVWFKLIPHFDQIISPSPFFNHSVFNYLYAIIAILLLVILTPYNEVRFYAGIVSIILPDGILGAAILGAIVASNYIGLALAITGNTIHTLTIVLLVGFVFFCLARINDSRTTRYVYTWYMVIVLINLFLIYLFVELKQHGKYGKGIIYMLVNSRNVWNKL